MSYIIVKRFFKPKWGENERKLSLHGAEEPVLEEIAQALNQELHTMQSKIKGVPEFKINKRAQFVAKMSSDFMKYYSEDFFVRCFNVMLKFGFKFDKQYDETKYNASTKELFVFLKMKQ